MTEAGKTESSSHSPPSSPKSNLTGESLVSKIETLGIALLLLLVTSVFVWVWLEPALQSEKSRSRFMETKNVNGLIGHWKSLERVGQNVREAQEGGNEKFSSAHELLTKAATMDDPTYTRLHRETEELLEKNGRNLNWFQSMLSNINPFKRGVE